jgi:hypothetical protein
LFLVYPWLAPIYNIPQEALHLIAIVSIVYSAYGILVIYKYIPRSIGVPLLAFMNAFWAFACCGIIFYYWPAIHWLAVVHFGFEALFVLGLAYIEFFNREDLIA